jgi:hypothetical protein
LRFVLAVAMKRHAFLVQCSEQESDLGTCSLGMTWCCLLSSVLLCLPNV